MEAATVELTKTARSTSIPFRPDIEGLRGVAVALVVVYHAGLPFLRAGLIGVDIFFVVSGYLITSLLTQELNSSGRINLPRFYARRARRLLPAATLVVVAVCLAEAILASPLVQARVLKDAVATMLYSSNIYFCQAKRSYFFSGNPPSPLIHTWSLAVEEQFYLAWPILLLLLARFTRSARVKVFFLALITLASLAGFLCLARTDAIMAFFQSPARAWEFGIGGLASFASLPRLTRNKNLLGWAGLAGLLAVVLSAEFLRASTKLPPYLITIPAVGTALILLAGAGAPDSSVAALLKWRPLQYLGSISYSLYLWHWPVLTIARNATSNNSLALRTGCILLAILLAAVTHAVVENPIRFHPVLMSRPRLSLGLAALSLTICIAGFAGWGTVLLHSQQFRKFHRAVEDAPPLHALGCNADIQPKLCFFGETSRPVLTAVLFGDSHAVQWFPPLKDIAEANRWKLVTMTKVGCSPMYVNTFRPENAAENPICDQWRTLALAKIREMRPDMVILTSSSQYPALGDPSRLVDLSDWERGSRKTFLALAQVGINIRFIRDTPHADYDVPSCLAQREWNGRATCPPLVRSRALDVDVYKTLNRAAANIASVRFVDLSDAFFQGDQCMPEKGDLVLFRDGDHMTSSFAESLAGPLQKQLVEGWNRQ